ncbi:MAG: hypothetical protein Q8L34_05065 [Candidatus Woesearchaeota archaeon]|nr:hypothetical protein [Candidatus Woesearchaeota archaeon]
MVDTSEIQGIEKEVDKLTPPLLADYWVVPTTELVSHGTQKFSMITRTENDLIDFLYYADCKFRMYDPPMPYVYQIIHNEVLVGFYEEALSPHFYITRKHPAIAMSENIIISSLGHPYIHLPAPRKETSRECTQFSRLLNLNRIPHVENIPIEELLRDPTQATLRAIKKFS